MDSVGDLLSKYRPEEPDEIAAIKRYVFDTFGEKSSVGLQNEMLVVTVRSASLANTLRLRILEIKKAANTERRIMFRIG